MIFLNEVTLGLATAAVDSEDEDLLRSLDTIPEEGRTFLLSFIHVDS